MSKDANENPRRARRGNGSPVEHALRADVKAYLDGELSPPRRWLLRWHLAQCAECREEMQWLQRLGEDMRDLEKATPRPELRARILANLPDTPPRPVTSSRRAPVVSQPHMGFPRLAMASVLLFAALGGVWALSSFGNSSHYSPQSATSVATAQSDQKTTRNVSSVPAHSDMAIRTNGQRRTQPLLVELKDYTDPTSRAAEQLMRQREVLDAEVRERKRQQESRANLASGPSVLPHEAPATQKPPLRLTLETQNSGTTRDSLAVLAHKLGGKAFDATAADHGAGDANSSAPVLALRIPSDNVSALVAGMSELGKVASSAPLPERMGSHAPAPLSLNPAATATAKPKVVVSAAPAYETPGKPLPIHGSVSSHAVPEASTARKPEEAKKPMLVTVFVILQNH